MKGCLSLPFRLLVLVLLVIGGVVAWANRDLVRRKIHEWTADRGGASRVGMGDASRAAGILLRIASLGSGKADSVLLSAGDVASLVAAAAAVSLPGGLDSVEVQLDRDDVEIHARVDTRKVPLTLGPLAGVVRQHEQIELGGPLLFRRSGLAEWQLSRVRVRSIPLPRDVVAKLLARLGGSDESVLPVTIPGNLGGLRTTRAGVVLYGARPAGGAR